MPHDNTQNLFRISLPFPMILAWDEKVKISSFLCHPLIHDPLKNALIEISETYTPEEIDSLKINRFGWCYNYRQKRNGGDWSSHSWAIAVDLDPENNKLAFGKSKASFAKPEFKPLIDIFYKHGFFNLGVEKGYDYMHFEFLIK